MHRELRRDGFLSEDEVPPEPRAKRVLGAGGRIPASPPSACARVRCTASYGAMASFQRMKSRRSHERSECLAQVDEFLPHRHPPALAYDAPRATARWLPFRG